MTDRPEQWTRRQFSFMLSAAAASPLLMRNAAAAAEMLHRKRFVLLALSEGVVRVCSDSSGSLSETHTVNALSPAHLLMHPVHSVLYVVHDVDTWQQRPRGAVSAYHLDTASARLSLLGSQPLSLSATNPQHAALTGTGDALFVAAEGGGIYNVLPIAMDGSLQPVSAIRKELGFGWAGCAGVAAPSRVARHADGSIYALDPGQETISQFAVSRDAITLLRRSRFDSATGTCDLALPAPPGEAHTYPKSAGVRSMLRHTVSS